MWDAVHNKTKNIYLATDIWDKFEKPHEEEWYCCELHKYPVTPVKAHKRKIGGEEINIFSHFRNLTDHFCPGESIEHWQTKVDIVLGLKEKRYGLTFRGEKIEYEIKNIDIEVAKDNRRADILLEIPYNSFLGYGIVIEVMVSETEEKYNLKVKDWIKGRYSITSINQDEKRDEIKIQNTYGVY